MADRWAVATGNWSDTGTWDGGTLPAAGDDVYADGYTVTINQNVAVASVRTTQRSGGTAGGGFTLEATWTLTANVIAGTTEGVTFNSASPDTATIVGNIQGGDSSNASGANNTSTGKLIIVGDVTGGTANNAYGARNSSSGTIELTGDATGGTGGDAYGIFNASTGSFVVYGDCTGGSGSTSNGCRNAVTGTVTINGNVSGGSGTNSDGCRNNNVGTIVVTGHSTGGSASTAYGSRNNSSGTLRVFKAIGSPASIAPGIYGGVSASITEVEEIEFGSSGSSPTYGFINFKDVSTNKCIAYISSGVTKTLVDPASVASGPRQVNIRGGADQ